MNKYPIYSEFSILINDYLNETASQGITQEELAKKTGIKRTNWSKYRNGKTVPRVKEFIRCLDSLPANTEFISTLKAAYYKLIWGEDKYNQINTVGNLISFLSRVQDNMPLKSEKAISLNNQVSGIREIDGEKAIKSEINSLVSREIEFNKRPKIDIYMSYPFPDFIEAINNFFYTTPIKVRHIMHLKEKSLDCAQLLTGVIPFLFSNTAYSTYQVFYHHGKLKSVNYQFYINFTDCVLLISPNFKKAVLCIEPNILSFYEYNFEQLLAICNSLVEYCSDPIKIMDFLHFDSKNTMHWIEYQPCFGRYFNKELIDKNLSTEIPNRDEILSVAVQRYLNLEKVKNTIGFFMKEGLIHFVETGIILDIPSQIVKPLSQNERLYLLEKYRDEIARGERTEYIANTINFSIPYDIFIVVSKRGIFFTKYLDNGYGLFSSICIKETSFCNAFDNFVNNAADATDFLYKKEETIKLIDENIAYLESLIQNELA